MIGFFRTACVKNDLKKSVIVNFLDFLSQNRKALCTDATIKTNQADPLIQSLELQKKFELFIERFFKSLQMNLQNHNCEVFEATETK